MNSASLTLRRKLREKINGLINYIDEGHVGMDLLKFIEILDDPIDVNSLIDEICLLLFPRPMSQAQKDFFKESLIPGLPDFEWAVEYGDYLSDPENASKRRSVENKLKQMFSTMFGVPEFHLS